MENHLQLPQGLLSPTRQRAEGRAQRRCGRGAGAEASCWGGLCSGLTLPLGENVIKGAPARFVPVKHNFTTHQSSCNSGQRLVHLEKAVYCLQSVLSGSFLLSLGNQTYQLSFFLLLFKIEKICFLWFHLFHFTALNALLHPAFFFNIVSLLVFFFFFLN